CLAKTFFSSRVVIQLPISNTKIGVEIRIELIHRNGLIEIVDGILVATLIEIAICPIVVGKRVAPVADISLSRKSFGFTGSACNPELQRYSKLKYKHGAKGS